MPYFTFLATNPCDTNNGDCEETCTNNNDAADCSCTSGTLNGDGKTCGPGNLCKFTLY